MSNIFVNKFDQIHIGSESGRSNEQGSEQWMLIIFER